MVLQTTVFDLLRTFHNLRNNTECKVLLVQFETVTPDILYK